MVVVVVVVRVVDVVLLVLALVLVLAFVIVLVLDPIVAAAVVFVDCAASAHMAPASPKWRHHGSQIA